MNTAQQVRAELDAAIEAAIEGFRKAQVQDAIVAGNADIYKPYQQPKDFTRSRSFPVTDIVRLMLSMQGGSLQWELNKAGYKGTSSAFIQQRNKADVGIFEDVFHYFNRLHNDDETYCGYKIYAIDGTTVNLARNPGAPTYMPKQDYNQFHVTPLYDILAHTYFDALIQPQPRQDERAALLFFLQWYDFDKNTLIIADRGFEGYNIFAHFMERDVKFLIRVRQDRSAMRDIRALPKKELDRDITMTITTTQTKEDRRNRYILVQRHRKGRENACWDFHSPYRMKLRVVRIRLSGSEEYETLVTNLPRRGFPAEKISELYHWRWREETAFRELKYGVGLINSHSRTDDNAMKEIWCALTVSNFCNRISREVVINQKRGNIHDYQVNQAMAVRLCRKFLASPGADGSALLEDIARYTEPVRQGRADKRKLRAKGFSGFTYRVPS